ncbi:MAG: cyclic lactone autoinducer peptide [Clostridia bacterium]
MKKIVKKVVEMYAKASTNSSIWGWFHQPKAPRCLIKK